MQTIFPKKENHIPKWFLIDANQTTLGRLACRASNLLLGKDKNFYTPGIDQGNFVIIINSKNIEISGNKSLQKLYYKPSNRPGNLKHETYKQLQNRIPGRVIEKAIRGMLPKGILGRLYIKRLYIYNNNPQILYNNENLKNSLIKIVK